MHPEENRGGGRRPFSEQTARMYGSSEAVHEVNL